MISDKVKFIGNKIILNTIASEIVSMFDIAKS